MCISPIAIPVREQGIGFSRDKGEIVKGFQTDKITGQLYHGNKYVYVPCGKCPECLKSKQNKWYVRFYLEDRYWKTQGAYHSWFLTLTYDNAHLPKNRSEALLDWQAFIKQMKRKLDSPPRFYVCSENGSKHGRLHFHAILFAIPDIGHDIKKLVNKCWSRGFTSSEYATGKSFTYVSKYVTKDTDPFRKENSWPTICTCSKHPALGLLGCSAALVRWLNSDDSNMFHIDNFTYGLPRYIAQNIYDQDILDKRVFDFIQSRGCGNDNSDNARLHAQDVRNTYYKVCREAKLKKTKRRVQYEKVIKD